jgi:hypothetical protein
MRARPSCPAPPVTRIFIRWCLADIYAHGDCTTSRLGANRELIECKESAADPSNPSVSEDSCGVFNDFAEKLQPLSRSSLERLTRPAGRKRQLVCCKVVENATIFRASLLHERITDQSVIDLIDQNQRKWNVHLERLCNARAN